MHSHIYFVSKRFLANNINRKKCIFAQIKMIKKYFYQNFGLVGRVFANGPGDLGSIPGRVIPKTLKMVLDTSLLNIQQYKVRIEGKVEQIQIRYVSRVKWSNPGKGVACSPSYWKGSLQVALD